MAEATKCFECGNNIIKGNKHKVKTFDDDHNTIDVVVCDKCFKSNCAPSVTGEYFLIW